MSRSTSKAAVKKAQGQLKVLVSSFGTLIMAWRNDTEQIVQLVAHYQELASKCESVRRVRARRHPVGESMGGMGMGMGGMGIPRLGWVCGQILAQVGLEVESALLQIRAFDKRLKDTVSAMLFFYEDGMRIVANEPAELFDPACIFTSDHILHIQQLAAAYAQELERKLALTHALYRAGASLCDAARPPEAPSEADVITRVLAQYPDSCSASCVDEESVQEYLLRNRINTD
mmetsp:Transcript_7961/g.17370  ORF Transcript_7961/g.17370 Transcript_7961/m.17370 type:complete len:231 (+) Transcript_7961:149-841(+)|eukprot:CAMPEP_0173174508 /NCGR_PEP_ID=MMETSP1141-20130122/3390_1 /TAXON_ID=483371 /ORGANISM="non described non described, Strain CCMP2298" /LENGTH=230 /DNA_ID=CAMNT_0014096637 /DNA_START=64 /DNA_END=756 /DNA_ORIENTATION=-